MRGPYDGARFVPSTESILVGSRRAWHDGEVEAYVQYCPVAVAAEVIGDRWTPLIVRELFLGSTRFNEIQRGIPRVSRTLLSGRLRRLESMGIITRTVEDAIPIYELTQSGAELAKVLLSLAEWAVRWSFGDPSPEQVNPNLLMWRMRQRVCPESLPAHRVTIQFDFRPPHRFRAWLVLDHADATVCVTDPGYEVDLVVQAHAEALERVYIGRLPLDDAKKSGLVSIEGPRRLTRDFERWFAWSPYHDIVAKQIANQPS